MATPSSDERGNRFRTQLANPILRQDSQRGLAHGSEPASDVGGSKIAMGFHPVHSHAQKVAYPFCFKAIKASHMQPERTLIE